MIYTWQLNFHYFEMAQMNSWRDVISKIILNDVIGLICISRSMFTIYQNRFRYDSINHYNFLIKTCGRIVILSGIFLDKHQF